MKELEKVLTEQIMDLQVNEVSSCVTEMQEVYFDRTEKDILKWKDDSIF